MCQNSQQQKNFGKIVGSCKIDVVFFITKNHTESSSNVKFKMLNCKINIK